MVSGEKKITEFVLLATSTNIETLKKRCFQVIEKELSYPDIDAEIVNQVLLQFKYKTPKNHTVFHSKLDQIIKLPIEHSNMEKTNTLSSNPFVKFIRFLYHFFVIIIT